jgi:hypothetical protein
VRDDHTATELIVEDARVAGVPSTLRAARQGVVAGQKLAGEYGQACAVYFAVGGARQSLHPPSGVDQHVRGQATGAMGF